MSKGRPPKVRTPQEKKRLSLAKDRRNAYGENDKSSRKAIRLRKAAENRRDRHLAAQDLLALPLADEARADALESTIRHDVYRIGGWVKHPDLPLREWVALSERCAENRAFRRVRRRPKEE